jgi:hypothetical protein
MVVAIVVDPCITRHNELALLVVCRAETPPTSRWLKKYLWSDVVEDYTEYSSKGKESQIFLEYMGTEDNK